MLDSYVRDIIDPSLNVAGERLANIGVSPNTLTLLGFGSGLLAMGAIVHQYYSLAALLILFNRLLDGLDGAVARQ